MYNYIVIYSAIITNRIIYIYIYIYIYVHGNNNCRYLLY